MMAGRRSAASGASLAETAVALAVISLAAAIGFTGYREMASRAPLRAAARELSAEFYALRFQAVAENRAYGLWFRENTGGWSWQRVRDGNGNGLRTAELRRGVDETLTVSFTPQDSRGTAFLGFVPGGPFPGVPPRRRRLLPGPDPVRFGSTDVISFRGNGHASSGTVYLTDGQERMLAVVLYGRTGRVRVWAFDRRKGEWRS